MWTNVHGYDLRVSGLACSIDDWLSIHHFDALDVVRAVPKHQVSPSMHKAVGQLPDAPAQSQTKQVKEADLFPFYSLYICSFRHSEAQRRACWQH